MKYRLTPAGRDLALHCWDDVHLVHQRRSGETHVFNETTASTLACLNDTPVSLATIVERVADSVGVDQGDLVTKDFSGVLSRLDELGLVDASDSGTSGS